MVLAQYGRKLSQRHRGQQRFVAAALAILHTQTVWLLQELAREE